MPRTANRKMYMIVIHGGKYKTQKHMAIVAPSIESAVTEAITTYGPATYYNVEATVADNVRQVR